MVDLAEAGAFDHARTAVPLTIVAGTAVGLYGLYRSLDRNPLVKQRPVEEVHAAAMAGIPRLVVVNGAVQVNLSGQVGVESVGARGRRITRRLEGGAAARGWRGGSRVARRPHGPVAPMSPEWSPSTARPNCRAARRPSCSSAWPPGTTARTWPPTPSCRPLDRERSFSKVWRDRHTGGRRDEEVRVGRLDGKVAFVTGAARGQGRSHAIALAREGADVIAVDICAQMPTVPYPMSTPADLAETAAKVEALDRRIVTAEADVRDVGALRSALQEGVAQLGGVDIVLANAGILSIDPGGDEDRVFRDVIDVNLVGVWNTVHLAAPIMIEQGRGGSIVLTSSTQGLTGRGGDGSATLSGYCAAKHGVVGLMRTFSHWLAPHNIRVNTIHPTGVNTPMIANEQVGQLFTERPGMVDVLANLMDVAMVEASDISNAILWLTSDEARFVTGTTLPVDAGYTVR